VSAADHEAAATAEPLYRRIYAAIEERILSDAWPAGHRIPSEHELTETWGCSRMTVNKALTLLAQAGYIERRRRAGSFVRHPHAQTAVLDVHDIETEVASLGLPYRYELLERIRRQASGEARARLGIGRRVPVLHLRCLHHAGKRPFCLEERLINVEAAPLAAGAGFDTEAPGAWLLRNVRWNLAEHRIRATGADAAVAAALAVPEGSPCLAIERRTWNQDQVVTWVRLTYAGDSHTLVARFAPSS
jgi:GntR family histidine utilization transcriptional repressor